MCKGHSIPTMCAAATEARDPCGCLSLTALHRPDDFHAQTGFNNPEWVFLPFDPRPPPPWYWPYWPGPILLGPGANLWYIFMLAVVWGGTAPEIDDILDPWTHERVMPVDAHEQQLRKRDFDRLHGAASLSPKRHTSMRLNLATIEPDQAPAIAGRLLTRVSRFIARISLSFLQHHVSLSDFRPPRQTFYCSIGASCDDFAAAQKRILERRAARESAIAAESQAHREARTAQLTRLPPTLRTYAYEFLNYYDLLKSPYGTSPAFRVGQVDAELLDEALLDLLRKQAGEGLKLFGAHLKDDWNAEITALLRIVYWKLSIWDHGTSYGASLQGLKYIDARGKDVLEAERMRKDATKLQRALYGLITVVGRYSWTRWEERLSSLENGYDEPSPLIKRLSRLTTFASTTHNITSFLSFLVFLYNGRYRTLTDRILRLRLVPSSNQTSREVSFEFLNRQLVWHAFTEFLLFLLPLVGISRWRRWLSKAWKKTKTTTIKLFSGAPPDQEDEDDDMERGELSFLPERTCAICYQDQNPTSGQSEQDIITSSAAAANSGITGSAMTDITNPYQAESCGCIYCFVCLAQRIEAEEGEGWVCLRCGEIIKECRPWHGDVVVRRERRSTDVSTKSGSRPSSGRKSVMFDLDAEKKDSDEDEREDSAMENVDPMPIEEEEWSRPDHSDDE
ncbi:hypothetical protein DOTSEDRAFT_78963 [Dothistroma septosporum NZE10]|uniref:Pex N-terminal domain-containing protein n=1 Tax=Dothistroma septosporum (strain NZE10 / CBS 128990) TaxID=675120 RepID=N1PV54_DOTSN|nr:hypothetical protein DOTSEDRAFT_78963 [Dothistroma septosporum NZE10]